MYRQIFFLLQLNCTVNTDPFDPNGSLTLEFGLSRTTNMTKMFALRAAWTAAATLSFPSKNKPRPSDTTSSNWDVSVNRKGQKQQKRIEECIRSEIDVSK